MNSFFEDIYSNSSIVETFQAIWDSLCTYLSDTSVTINNKKFITVFENLPDNLYFDEFQWTLLKALLILLVINLLLTFLAWKYYGKRICERFMRPATSRAIEELKASVARLKLPKEHTPRI